jgi:cysteine-rich repeat protein
MRLTSAVLWLVCASCIEADLVPCGNGLTCPTGRTCVLLTDPDQTVCASAADLAACKGLDDGALCTRSGGGGVCLGGACVPIECGNWRVDPGEMCDDGNTVTGDGSCSADCLSDETCGNGVVDPLRIIDDAREPAEQCDDGNLVSSDGCSSTCRVESPRWIKVESKIVPASCGAASADLARNRIVAFGGLVGQDGGAVPSDGTFEWNGKGWVRAPSLIVPQARQRHAMAYDAQRHRIVMFGGNIGDIDFALGDTWEWEAPIPPRRVGSAPRVTATRPSSPSPPTATRC